MRTWLLAISALMLVALTGPIAGEKRSSALAVRVTVARSCSVSTESALQTGGTVSCGTRFGPPVMSTSSTISVPAPAAPAALIESSSVVRDQLDRATQQSEVRGVPAARQAEVTQRISETMTAQVPAAATTAQSETVTIRVMTVNF